MGVLEVLRRAEVSLEDDGQPFEFDSWRFCTCGHIHLAATGKVHYSDDNETQETFYRHVIEATARALGYKGQPQAQPFPTDGVAGFMGGDAAIFVSDYTDDLAAAEDEVSRFHALGVIRAAIETIETEEAAHAAQLSLMDLPEVPEARELIAA